MRQMDAGDFNSGADRRLVEGFVRTGDEATFRELYRRHTPALYLLALRLAGNSKDEAKDAVQETWLRACRTLKGFEWRSSLRTWLTGILINRVREMHRERVRRGEEELREDMSAEVFCAHRDGARAPERMDVEQAIARLPAGYRHVLVLHDVQGYTHEEIGARLEISVGTSKSQLHHARRAMRLMVGASEVHDE